MGTRTRTLAGLALILIGVFAGAGQRIRGVQLERPAIASFCVSVSVNSRLVYSTGACVPDILL